jgi:hypothetical protein
MPGIQSGGLRSGTAVIAPHFIQLLGRTGVARRSKEHVFHVRCAMQAVNVREKKSVAGFCTSTGRRILGSTPTTEMFLHHRCSLVVFSSTVKMVWANDPAGDSPPISYPMSCDTTVDWPSIRTSAVASEDVCNHIPPTSP